MAILSGGELVLAETTPSFFVNTYRGRTGENLIGQFSTYGAIYRAQIWVAAVVDKLAMNTARLPLQVFRRVEDGREQMRDSSYAQLLSRPNAKHDSFFFWLWTVSTLNVYGEAIWLKLRGRDGKPAELWPLHPSNVVIRKEDDVLTYFLYHHLGGDPAYAVSAEDVVHFKRYNPDTTLRGMSALEPLRQTLANEDAARRATSSFWKNGARPGVALTHPKKLSTPAAERLRADWDALHAGPDATGNTAVLEEGMTPQIIPLNLEEAQYIDTRKLNREEVCGAYDIPPPVVHILDRATFSNITEQMRSMYRDTMAPRLEMVEAVIDHQLRPEFEDTTVKAKFLLDDVLRGDFEVRADAYQKAINSGWMQPSEVRTLENLTPAKGADRLFVNSTLVPIDVAASRMSPNPSALEAGKPAEPPMPPPKAAFTDAEVRTLMGRLSRVGSLADVSLDALTKDLNGSSELVEASWATAVAARESVPQFRQRLKSLGQKPGEPA
ncbi:MAG: phage portal protein [Actinobacteria bacterium]|nr:phage portal protein [Actinomycetota bacterium]